MQVVKELMSGNVTTLGRNDRLSLAEDLMHASRIRHLPVLNEGGQLVGILSQRDLFHSALVRALGFGTTAKDKMLQSIAVKNVMTDHVHTTTPDTPVTEAARMMLEHKVGCLPVMQSDELVGILTEGDFVAAAAGS
ncbi:MAG: CBS domain-containing protein [Vicinamibacterales bacterium]|jgi:CBS domain-containing protein|nr:CBS domain-containing protein [Vicinamibacterales bacterium]